MNLESGTAAVSERQAVIENLYAKYGALVFRTCRAILLDHHDAEDATQEVFAKLFIRDAHGAVRDQRRWLLEVTRNHCIDRLRAAARRPDVLTGTDYRAAAGEDAEERSLARDHLRWLLSLLTPRQRDVLVRQAVLDEPLDTVAAQLGMTYGAAAQLLQRARALLARTVGDGRALVMVVGGRLAGVLRRLRSRVIGVSVNARVQVGRAPLDPALALPAAALLVALLAGGSPAAAQDVPRPTSSVHSARPVSTTRIAAVVPPPASLVASRRELMQTPTPRRPDPAPPHPALHRPPPSALEQVQPPCFAVLHVLGCLPRPLATSALMPPSALPMTP